MGIKSGELADQCIEDILNPLISVVVISALWQGALFLHEDEVRLDLYHMADEG